MYIITLSLSNYILMTGELMTGEVRTYAEVNYKCTYETIILQYDRIFGMHVAT